MYNYNVNVIIYIRIGIFVRLLIKYIYVLNFAAPAITVISSWRNLNKKLFSVY